MLRVSVPTVHPSDHPEDSAIPAPPPQESRPSAPPSPAEGRRRDGWLEVGDGHALYWEDSGNPDGLPVVYLHGGPGAGCTPAYRRFFDPARWRIVLFDQRGAGRSRPYAETRANTTAHLVADIERLRLHLGIPAWVAFGGSWGSTLALAYGQAHPERVLGFVLRGVFLFREREVAWFLDGMGRFFPEAAAAFRARLPEAVRTGDWRAVLAAYRHLLDHPDPAVHGPAARAWVGYEDACARLLPRLAGGSGGPDAPAPGLECLAMARLEAHYMAHGGFLAEGELIDPRRLERISHLPCIIVQGRYDVVCPPETAWELHRAWPGSSLTMVPDAGHSALEPGIASALARAAQSLVDRLGVPAS